MTDKGSDMVVRFNPAGRVTMVFGRKPEASDEERASAGAHPQPPLPPIDRQFRQVTDVAWDSQGNIYISDGYINSRVAKYDKDGNWVASCGEPGTGRGQFNTLHSIVDRRTRTASTSPTAATAASRCRHRRARCCAMITIDVPAPPNAPGRDRQPLPATGGRDAADAGLAVGDLHHAAARAGALRLRRVPGRIYKMSLDGKVLGLLGGVGKQLEASSAGSTRSRARRRTSSTSRSC